MIRTFIAGSLLLLGAATSASAATYVVKAFDHSTGGGVGLATVSVTAGDLLTVSASTDDLWSAGALPRFSDANGLNGVRFATASDDSGQPVGTQIGADFGLLTLFGKSYHYGSLVGEIGGVYQKLGTSFSGPAWGTGTLNLWYWDINQGDNFGDIAVSLRVGPGTPGIPEPATWALMIAGFGLLGFAARRRRIAAARA